MNTRSLKLSWLQLGGVGAVFMSIFLSTYVLKIHVNADNVANGQYLATLVEDNPIYHQINYHEYDVQERMNEQELIDYGQMIYANRQEPTVIRLKQPQAITTKDAISVGKVEEVDFYIAKKQAALWYILHFPLHATIKENLSAIFILKQSVDFKVDLKNSIAYAKIKTQPNVTLCWGKVENEVLDLIQAVIYVKKAQLDPQGEAPMFTTEGFMTAFDSIPLANDAQYTSEKLSVKSGDYLDVEMVIAVKNGAVIPENVPLAKLERQLSIVLSQDTGNILDV